MDIFPQRKSLRLKNYDYSQVGLYFITICTQDKKPYFGQIVDGVMQLNSYGQIVNQCISKIGDLHIGLNIDCKVVMPNHVHFIIKNVGVAYYATRNMEGMSTQEKSKMLVPKIIQQFKTSTIKLTKQVSGLHAMQPLQWQRGYYEHIIRDENSYQKIYEYIESNPLRWELDQYYSD
ncbi:REP element-mobilizing transposase RayT [Anaerosolibacter carboniphilus]|uniref:REP element-mobilizing transposase RayT n=1 Tax=Anaerosolibacter carboniphilus TaxID=1417629 RepID=A0A841L819_9FIRM|nr:transposase [Anaerosolibacter carboniphilus]MBB6218539.1 REP element-mobilizing transposase RayT [Anaerosolibacter carboniphilus]